jgi:Leucine-rich repeat (LRR) protein
MVMKKLANKRMGRSETKWSKLFIRLGLLLHFSFFIFHFSFSQITVPDSTFIYTNLEEALIEPEKVYHLDLSKKKIQDFPMEILKLINLRSLKLYKNRIDSIPNEISQLKNLRELNVGLNDLTKFNLNICQLTNLEKLVLNQNEIEEIPAEIKNLTKLAHLDMWDNNLFVIPDEIGELKETLKVFDLQNIQFNTEEQKRINGLLPKTKVTMPPSCNCKD